MCPPAHVAQVTAPSAPPPAPTSGPASGPAPTPTRAAPFLSGALAIGGAKAWFLVAGLVQSVVTPLAIGQEGFGAFKRAMAFVNVPNNILIVASIQAVSRAIAGADEGDRPATMRRAITTHAILGIALGLGFAAMVPLIVAHQRAPHLAPPLYAFAVVLAAYGLYAPLVGGLNGTRRFARQAMLDAGFSTTRTVLICVVGYLFARDAFSSSPVSGGGAGALGAALGFAATAILILPVALASIPLRGPGTARLQPRSHLLFLATLASAQLFQSLLLQMDLVLLGRLAVTRWMDAGLSQLDANVRVDRLAGLYAQAQTFGLVPYQILVAVAYVLFPAIAAARARGDEAALRGDVERGGRATLLVAGLLVATIAGTPVAILRFAYGSGITASGSAIPSAEGAPIVQALACAHGLTALAMVGITLVAATGKGRTAALLSATVFVTTSSSALVAALLHPGVDVGLGVALARGMFVGLAIGATVVVVHVRRSLGRYVTIVPLARTVIGVAVACLLGRWVPTPSSRVLCALVPAVPLVIFLGIVLLLGERPASLLRRNGKLPAPDES